jgi:hypothetical protein
MIIVLEKNNYTNMQLYRQVERYSALKICDKAKTFSETNMFHLSNDNFGHANGSAT